MATGRDARLPRRTATPPDGPAIIATGPDGRIILFDPGAEGLLGYTAQQMMGCWPDRLHAHGDLERHAEALDTGSTFHEICRGAVTAGDLRRVWQWVRRDGTVCPVVMTISALPENCGYVCFAEDVSNRDLAQAALTRMLEQQQQQLRELDRVTSDVVSAVSHELRTPIAGIRGFAELLEDGAVGELSAGQRELVARIDHNARRLLALVEDLLTLAQVESAALRLDPVACDLRDAVLRARAQASPLLAGRTLDVVVSVPDEPLDFLGDPAQLERMVANLLTNAVKFTPDAGAVTVTLAADAQAVTLVVADTGIGIPIEDHDRLFTRFYRSATATSTAVQGTGLGLSIVQVIASLHGGTVAIESAVDAGTTATVTLPRT